MICHCLRFICPCLIWLKLKPGYTAPLPATALRDSMTSSQRCGSHYCPAEAPRHGKAWNNVDPKPRTWSWNLLSWFGICSFSHTLQDQVTKSAGCGMLVAHFPNHCLAHKSWPNTKVTIVGSCRVQNGLSIPEDWWSNLASPSCSGPAWHRSFGQMAHQPDSPILEPSSLQERRWPSSRVRHLPQNTCRQALSGWKNHGSLNLSIRSPCKAGNLCIACETFWICLVKPQAHLI